MTQKSGKNKIDIYIIYTFEALFEEDLRGSDREQREKKEKGEKIRVANPNRHGFLKLERDREKRECFTYRVKQFQVGELYKGLYSHFFTAVYKLSPTLG